MITAIELRRRIRLLEYEVLKVKRTLRQCAQLVHASRRVIARNSNIEPKNLINDDIILLSDKKKKILLNNIKN